MNDRHETKDSAGWEPLRAERSTAAVVAQYIHELSPRHAVGAERLDGPDCDDPRI